MPRQTSREVYELIENNGLLSKRRFQTYRALYFYGPMTANEIVDCIQKDGVRLQPNSISPRLAELERSGAVAAYGTRKCAITGYDVTLWDVTSKLPDKQKIKNPKRKFWIAGQIAFSSEKEAEAQAAKFGQEVIRVIER
jgi:hypothetical protein